MISQNNIAPDMDALLAWLKEQALEAHKTVEREQGYVYARRGQEEETTLNRVIAKIENSRVNQRPHVPQGWDEVD